MSDFSSALKHFETVDEIMADLTRQALAHPEPPQFGAPSRPEQYFERLVGSIVSQQLSVKAADTIWSRLENLAGAMTPEALLSIPAEKLRGVGLSRAKAAYISELAQGLLSGTHRLDDLHNLSDEAVIERLVSIKGIGRWSAEMFLMFSLNRPDVFSAGDLGLLRAVEAAYNRPGIDNETVGKLAERWSPFRTHASLVLWHSRDNRPL